MKTGNIHQKHITLDKRIKIEKEIEEGKNFSEIAEDISKSYKMFSNKMDIV